MANRFLLEARAWPGASLAQLRRVKALRLLALVGLGVAAAIAVVLAIAQDQQTLKVRSAVASDDPRALAYVAKLVGGDISGGNRFRALTNGDEIFPAMLDAIAAAERRIVLETYIYEKGRIAEKFTNAFVAAARRGVDVSLVVDYLGSDSMSEDHVRRLREAGCKVATFNESRWYTLEEVNYRTHRKILVIDGDVAFTGGVGIADYWTGDAQGPEHWRDTQIELRGPIARLLEGAFYENYIETDDIVTPAADEGDLSSAIAEGDSLLVRSVPSGGSSDLKRLYLLAIGIARRTIDIQSPYFIADASGMWSLEDALARGVRVRILMESDLTDAKPVKYSSRADYERLLRSGAELYEYQPTLMHAKVMIVDGRWSMFGSANFDNRSLELNDELNVLARHEELAARLLADFEHDLRRSRQITLDEWLQRSWLEKSREKFWGWFGEIF
jgi:cardiolipin synthase